MSEDLTWTCHICGDERPDEMIGVFKHYHPGGLQENVRYCLDRAGCRQTVPVFCLFGKSEEHQAKGA
jgi:hypothetical protein